MAPFLKERLALHGPLSKGANGALHGPLSKGANARALASDGGYAAPGMWDCQSRDKRVIVYYARR